MYGYDGSIDWNMYFGNYDSDICLSTGFCMFCANKVPQQAKAQKISIFLQTSINELVVLANMESFNAELIKRKAVSYTHLITTRSGH